MTPSKLIGAVLGMVLGAISGLGAGSKPAQAGRAPAQKVECKSIPVDVAGQWDRKTCLNSPLSNSTGQAVGATEIVEAYRANAILTIFFTHVDSQDTLDKVTPKGFVTDTGLMFETANWKAAGTHGGFDVATFRGRFADRKDKVPCLSFVRNGAAAEGNAGFRRTEAGVFCNLSDKELASTDIDTAIAAAQFPK